ncbi:MAG: radical SAM family heme chaperone HemW [Ruthenibacterium sp.]
MLGVYIHVPYCEGKCYYCDFYSAGGSHAVPDAYVDALLRDILAAGGCAPLRPDTVYFGGGTPSLLTAVQVRRILAALCPVTDAEITLEANPGTVTPASLAAFFAAGVNRLSVGVQTASDESLVRIGRRHTVQDSRDALRFAREAGFTNISGDIMLALPAYTLDELSATADLLAEGGCTHVSAYLLKIEPDTVFGKRPPQFLPDDDAAADFYLACVQGLAARGFAQYEISNFAKPGCESRHNLIYWNCRDYLGFGPAAHSCAGGQRFSVPTGTARYLTAPQPPVPQGVVDAEDFIMLQLRLHSGLSLTSLHDAWGVTFPPKTLHFLKTLQAQGLACFDGETLTLTPRGMLVQNSIVCELI